MCCDVVVSGELTGSSVVYFFPLVVMNCAWAVTTERSRGIITLRTQDKISAKATSHGVSEFAVFVEPGNDDRRVLSGRECYAQSILGAGTLGGDGGCVRDGAVSPLSRDDIFVNVDN